MISQVMPTLGVSDAYDAAVDRWVSCDWTTEFGVLKLNVENLKSSQLERLAKATSGQESQEWRKAAAWVEKIEVDANNAQDLATLARDAFLDEDLSGSIAFAEKAFQLEKTWHHDPVWGRLLAAIQNECFVTEMERGGIWGGR